MKTAALVLVLTVVPAAPCSAQAKPPNLDTTYGSCSPNMSHNSGTVNIHCTGLDPAVATEIAELVRQLSLLNRKTAAEKNQRLMINMLRELKTSLESATAQNNTVNGGVNQGDCGVVQLGGSGNVASPACGPIERHITDAQRSSIAAALNGKHVTVHVSYLVNVPDAQQFADELCDAIKDGIPTTNCSQVWAVLQEGRTTPWYGFKLAYKGDPVADGQRTTLSFDSPAGMVMRALVAAGLNQGVGHADPAMKDDEVEVVIGAPPKIPREGGPPAKPSWVPHP